MTTFRPFPRLPLELREQIWKDTVEPRTVDVRRFQAWPQHYGRLVSSTPIPAILQSCREARNLGLYKKVFFEGEEAESSKTEQRYVWMDLDIDIMDIGTSKFDHYKHIAPAVKRLKFERENTDEYFYFHEVLEMMQFINVEEIHIVCADGFWNWGGALHEHNFPCADEKLLFIDALDGRVARGMEMEKIYREMLMAVRIANTGEAYNTDDEFSS
ncbi:hypothetical protein COCCADRAFT_95371 [Bipolaris zeicola 26-R-13]|uniref:2EXR domain-containing protein n=1 Tax=Cochliobolus carbonum (strain 26-R-13) TaxID=930089 RepID=W6Y882_COCC2|nr:uncharacterized protein COCCADRAFT_95371 [Bipolaris zeicola 26-R-13]EUC33675.1 hypothetical protein COCCADRAFT_95371 [Bipolaris zeicola 26-R-13]